MKKLLAVAILIAAPAFATLTDISLGRLIASGNGATTAYHFTFPAVNKTDVQITVTLAGVAQGFSTTISLNGDQSASPGGTVTFAVAPANGAAITIQRAEPLTQTTVYAPYTPFPAKTTERALDATVRKIQQVKRDINDLSARETQDIANVIAGGVGAANLIAPVATGSSTARTLADRFAQTRHIKDFNALCDGLSDDSSGFNSAIAALPSTGGVVDARGCAAIVISNPVTINKKGVLIQLPSTTVTMGANQFIVPVGTHSVTIQGLCAHGENAGGVQTCTNIVYTGTTTPIVVGDSSADTYSFKLSDLAIGIFNASAGAYGVRLNRTIGFRMENIRVGTANALVQWGMYFKGTGNYTGGVITNAWISYGLGAGMFFGDNANAISVIGAHVEGNFAGSCFDFDGEAVGSGGNRIFGGDCENATNALHFDYTSDNQVFGLRVEGVTNAANATAHATQNWSFTSGTNAMAVIDAGANNVFSDNYFTQLGRNTWKMKNTFNTPSTLILNSGLNVEQVSEIQLCGLTECWRIDKQTDANFLLWRQSTGLGFLHAQASNAWINSASGGVLGINMEANSGTGGFQVGNGGASPVVAFAADANGTITVRPRLFVNLGTPANGTFNYCSDCTVANPCAGGGTGAWAKRLNGAWVCN